MTIGLTLFAGELMRRRHARQQRKGIKKLPARRLIAHEPSASAATPATPRAADLPRRRQRPQQRRRRRSSLASRSRCETSPANAAQPCRGPPRDADARRRDRDAEAVAARPRASEQHRSIRSERAATAWSTSISVPAATAVRTGAPPSGAATAAASSACASGSEAATRYLRGQASSPARVRLRP